MGDFLPSISGCGSSSVFFSIACLLVCFGDGFDPLEVNCTSSSFSLSRSLSLSLSSSSSSFPKSRREFGFPFHRFCLLVFISLRVLVLP